MSGSPDSLYGWLMLLGIVASAFFWLRLARRDDRLIFIYIAALSGGFLGAKLVYLAAEGWLHFGAPDMWLQLATGKSILGALLGGYIAVEAAKRFTGYSSITSDWFATIVPVAIVIGRIGCLLHGCCLGEVCDPRWFTLRDAAGIARWPAVPVEIAFNLAAVAVLAGLRSRRILEGQHFHLYLMGYGIFRFAHEFARATPKLLGPFSGYQWAAVAVFVLGAVRFAERARAGAKVSVLAVDRRYNLFSLEKVGWRSKR